MDAWEADAAGYDNKTSGATMDRFCGGGVTSVVPEAGRQCHASPLESRRGDGFHSRTAMPASPPLNGQTGAFQGYC